MYYEHSLGLLFYSRDNPILHFINLNMQSFFLFSPVLFSSFCFLFHFVLARDNAENHHKANYIYLHRLIQI